MYVSDNGTIQCSDINSLEPVWIFDAEDDTDSTMVIEEEEDGVFICPLMRWISAVPIPTGLLPLPV